MRDNEYIYTGYRVNYLNNKDIIKSIFMFHNETVNIWSHGIGFILFLFAFIYIGLYINYKHLFNTFDNIFILYSRNELYNKSFFEHLQYHEELFLDILKNKTEQNYEIIQNTIPKSAISSILENTKNKRKISDYSQYLQDSDMKFILQIINNGSSIIFEEQKAYVKNMIKWPIFIHLIGILLYFLFSCSYHLFYPKSANSRCFLRRLDYSGINILIVCTTFSPYTYDFSCELCTLI